jgi:molybdenum-dependent DNA-binding transcriptional regulator ModE
MAINAFAKNIASFSDGSIPTAGRKVNGSYRKAWEKVTEM